MAQFTVDFQALRVCADLVVIVDTAGVGGS